MYLRNTVKRVTKDIGSLKKYKIIFGNFEDGDIYPYVVDGVHCMSGKCCCTYMFDLGSI